MTTDQRVRTSPDDPTLAALLFNYGRYLLISSSREGTLPATLQGLWNEQTQPPWSSNYTLNINTQMSYWAAESVNLAESH
jgi:alpha-L-fucosidase 2